jgi:inhibitor of cysteine peptidase
MKKYVVSLLCGLAIQSVMAAQAPTVYTQDKQAISVSDNNPEFVIQLKSNATTGYSWFLRDYDAKLIQPIKHVYEAPANKKLMGAPGLEVWTFKAKPAAFAVPQQTMIRFVYTRPWDADSSQSTQLVYSVTTAQGQGKK